MLKGRVILFEKDVPLLNREQLIDSDALKQDLEVLSSGKPFDFLPHDSEIDRFSTKSPAAFMYGVTNSGAECSLKITDMPFGFAVVCKKMMDKTKKTCLHNTLNWESDRKNIFLSSDEIKECKKNEIMKNFMSVVGEYSNGLVGTIQSRWAVVKTMEKLYGHPEMIACIFTFQTIKLRETALKIAYENPEFYVADNCAQNAIIEIEFAKRNISVGNWVKVSNYEFSHNDDNTTRYLWKDERKLGKDNPHSKNRKMTKALFCTQASFNDVTNLVDEENGVTEEEVIIVKPKNNLICAWDIETIPDDNVDASGKEILGVYNKIFNIHLTFRLGKGPLLHNVSIFTTKNGKGTTALGLIGENKKNGQKGPKKNTTSIVCKNYVDVLRAFISVCERTRPDFMLDYNGGQFDRPMLFLHLRHNNLFDEYFCRLSANYIKSFNENNVTQLGFDNNDYHYSYKSYDCDPDLNSGGYAKRRYTSWSGVSTNSAICGYESGTIKIINDQPCGMSACGQLKSMKLEANLSVDYHMWNPEGTLFIDLYFTMVKKYPKEPKKSLNTFLQKYELEPKEDLSYSEMWKIYRNNDFDRFNQILTYCGRDCTALLDLFDKCMYELGNRMTAYKSLCSLPSVVYLADGAKNNICITGTAFYERQTVRRVSYIYDAVYEKILAKNNIKPGSYDDFLKDHKRPTKSENKGGRVDIYNAGKTHDSWILDNKLIPELIEIYGVEDNKCNRAKLLLALEEHTKCEVETYLCNPDGTEVMIPCDEIHKHDFSNIHIVFKIVKPVDALDFASLYPMVMITFNLSPEMITQDEYEAMIYGKENIRTHTEDLLDSAFKKINKNIYILEHHNDPNQMGILCLILLDWYKKRVSEKKKKGFYHAKMEAFADGLKEGDDPENHKEYREFKVKYLGYDMAQLATKVQMNSVYGIMLDKNHSLYNYLIAFLVTVNGRRSVRSAQTKINEYGCRANYTDTDSVYYDHATSRFDDIIIKLVTKKIDREAYDRKMVHRSMKLSFTVKQLVWWYMCKTTKSLKAKLEDSKKGSAGWIRVTDALERMTPKKEKYIQNMIEKYKNIKPDDIDYPVADKINDHFIAVTFYNYIRMVREETLYPAIFMAKKKYFGVKHEDYYNAVVDSIRKHFLVRGIQLVTRNSSKFVTDCAEELLFMTVKSQSTDLRSIIETYLKSKIDAIKKTGKIEGDYKRFEAKGRYKPSKANTPMTVVNNTLVYGINSNNPKIKELCITPDPIEVVNYVEVVRTNHVMLNMNKLKEDSKKDLLLYTSVAELDNIPINYVSVVTTILQLGAQFIAYHPDFKDTDEEIARWQHYGIWEEKKSESAKRAVGKSRKHLNKWLKEEVQELPQVIRSKEIILKCKEIKKFQPKLYEDWIDHTVQDENCKNLLTLMKNIDTNPVSRIIDKAETITTDLGCEDMEDVTSSQNSKNWSDTISLRRAMEAMSMGIDRIYIQLIYRFNQNLIASIDNGEEMIDVSNWSSPVEENQMNMIKVFYYMYITYACHHNRSTAYSKYQSRALMNIDLPYV